MRKRRPLVVTGKGLPGLCSAARLIREWHLAIFYCKAKLDRYRGVADMAGIAARSVWSRMARSGHSERFDPPQANSIVALSSDAAPLFLKLQ
jgi:hypothetical protein